MVGKKRFGTLVHAVGAMEQAREHSPAEQGPAEPHMSRMARAVRVTVASVAAAAMLGAVCVAPANALADVNADAATAAAGASGAASGASGSSVSAFKTQTIADASDDADAMPENPNAALPDKVSSEIADDATVVSEQYAATPEGELKDIETGETVTDPKIVGTESKQPDPLAKTDGESFIPVSAADVKEKVAANGGDVNAGATNGANDADGTGNTDAGASGNADGDATTQQDDSASQQSAALSAQRQSGAVNGAADSRSSVQLAALQNNEYGAHWGSYNGTQAFFDAHNNLFAQQAKGVIDVSEWQHTIDWQKVKNAGVEGAIIRLSYGWGNGFDAQARRNISECKRLGIPFGVYVFSYAESAADGASEGADVVNLLRQAGVNPGDLSYPVFYDLETWSYTGHKSPTSPSMYEGIVNAWYGKMKAAGYTNLGVYSYTSYLNSALNSGNIHGKTRWVAQYGSTMQYTAFPTNDRGWQYTSGGTINGISGRVDLNAFGNYESTAPVGPENAVYRLYHAGINVHHYTADAHEMTVLVNQQGWNYEGVLFQAAASGQPVYRLYHPGIKQHLFTLSLQEKNVLSKQRGWKYEGIAWYSNPNGQTAIYRLYNNGNYEHFYTTSYQEYVIRGSQGWIKEGVAWKAD